MFLATTNPSVCKITRQLPLRTILNNGKFYTFDNGSCTLYTESGYLNTTNAGTTAYYYFPNNDGCGSGVATCFTGCDWSNLNSWRSVGGEVPELLPFSLSSAVISSACTIVLTCNSGPIPYVNSILFCGSTNGITLCANNISLCTFGLSCYSVNCGSLCGDVYFAINAHNYGIICATGSQTITTNGFNYGSGYGTTINVGKGNERNGLFSGQDINFNVANTNNNGTIIGSNITFSSSSVNTGIVSGNLITFTCTSANRTEINTTGVLVFNSCSVNYGTISGNPYFYLSARNCGTIFGLACFSGYGGCARNHGYVIGDASFHCPASVNCGIVSGNSYFCKSSNYGTVSGLVYFNDFFSANCGLAIGNVSFCSLNSRNCGTVFGNIIFGSYSENNGGVSGNVCFCNGAANCGFVTGLVYFSGTACNYSGVIGNAYFDSYSKNFGTVSGTGYFKNLACNSGVVTCVCLY